MCLKKSGNCFDVKMPGHPGSAPLWTAVCCVPVNAVLCDCDSTVGQGKN